jgi:hypothetical protein
MYVLIVIAWFGQGAYSNTVAFSAEYESIVTCTVAKNMLVESFGDTKTIIMCTLK